VLWYPLRSQKPGLSVAENSMPRSHFALFQAYSRGTTNRAGWPCSAVSGSPFARSATRQSSRRQYSIGTFAVKPCSECAMTNFASGVGWASSTTFANETPSHF